MRFRCPAIPRRKWGRDPREIERLKKQDISDDELKMIKTRTKANLIRGLGDNEGLATQLAIYQTRYGDWRELFRSVDRIDKVTKADIRRVANETFQDTNRTVGVIENAMRRGTKQRARSRSGRCAMKTNLKPVSMILVAAILFVPLPRAASQATNWQQIPIPPLSAFHPQQPKRIELSNGMVIFLQEDHELPLIDGSARVRGGSRNEPAGKVGLVDLFGEVWRTGGTKDANWRPTRRLSRSACRQSRNRRRARFDQHQLELPERRLR